MKRMEEMKDCPCVIVDRQTGNYFWIEDVNGGFLSRAEEDLNSASLVSFEKGEKIIKSLDYRVFDDRGVNSEDFVLYGIEVEDNGKINLTGVTPFDYGAEESWNTIKAMIVETVTQTETPR